MVYNKRKKRKRLWTPKEVDLLIESWKARIFKLRGTRRNEHLMEEIKEELENNNCTVSVLETRNKIHNLTNKYVKEKSIYKQTGIPSTWTLYSKLNTFLGRCSNKNEEIIDSDDDCSFGNENFNTSQACSTKLSLCHDNNSKTGEFVICRSCVGECTNFKSLYKIGLLRGEKTTLATLLSFCTNLEFSDHESTTLPSFICAKCIHELTKSYIFIKKVQEADKLFRVQPNPNNSMELNEIPQEHCKVKVENELNFNKTEIKSELSDTNSYTRVDDTMTYNILQHEDEPDIDYETVVTKEETQLQEIEKIEVKNETEDCDIQKTDTDLPPEKQYDMENNINPLEISPNINQDNSAVDLGLKPNHNEAHFFTCKVCSRQFKKKNSFVCQIQSDKTYYKCKVCDGSFKTICAFGGHKSTHNKCARSNQQRSTLKKHSPGLETFICHICGKQFDRKCGYKIHMLRHKEEKRSSKKHFLCDICGIAFYTYRKMWSHRNIHCGLRKYKCSKCFKRFSKAKQLERHALGHTKKTYFNCHICSQSFQCKSSMLIHLRIHEKIVTKNKS